MHDETMYQLFLLDNLGKIEDMMDDVIAVHNGITTRVAALRQLDVVANRTEEMLARSAIRTYQFN